MPLAKPLIPLAPQLERVVYDEDTNMDALHRNLQKINQFMADVQTSLLSINKIGGELWLQDGITAPSTNDASYAKIYIDTADGDLKIRFADGTVKTIVVDT